MIGVPEMFLAGSVQIQSGAISSQEASATRRGLLAEIWAFVVFQGKAAGSGLLVGGIW